MVKKAVLPLYVLYVNAAGLSIFSVTDFDSTVKNIRSARVNVTDFTNFSQTCTLKTFCQFSDVDEANDITAKMLTGQNHPFFERVVKMYLPKATGDKPSFVVGVCHEKFQIMLKEIYKLKVKCNEDVLEIVRGLERHFLRFVTTVTEAQLRAAEISLAHAMSRDKVRFNPKRDDTMVTQAIALLETYNKQSNTLYMRLREWAGWHFPELVRLISDPLTFARAVAIIKTRDRFESKGPEGSECRKELKELVGVETYKDIIMASRSSMGVRLYPLDADRVAELAERSASLEVAKRNLQSYIDSRMDDIAPNLTKVVGSTTGAKLLLQAGSLSSLCKLPATTIQVLGAQKALFRAMKSRKGRTPKYGVIYGVPAIISVGPKMRGRIARCIAAKAALASRIDFFRERPDSAIGERLHKKVEQRARFLNGK